MPKSLSTRFVLPETVRTQTVGILLHDSDHLLPVDLHLLAPAVVISVAEKDCTTFLTFFLCHITWSWLHLHS